MDNSKNFSLNEHNRNVQKYHMNLTKIDMDTNNNKNLNFTDSNRINDKINSTNNNLISKVNNYNNHKRENNSSKNNIFNKNSVLYNPNISKNSYNLPQEASNFSNKFSNEIQIRSKLQIKDLTNNNNISNHTNPTIEKVKNFQKIQKLKINYDSQINKINFHVDRLNDNANKNKVIFKSTNDEIFSSDQKENLTKDPSFKSSICKGQYIDNKILDTNQIILENKLNNFEINNDNFKRSANKFKTDQSPKSPVLILNDFEGRIENDRNIEKKLEANNSKHNQSSKNNNKKVILEKT